MDAFVFLLLAANMTLIALFMHAIGECINPYPPVSAPLDAVPPQCAVCGYPTTGLPRAICPECGSDLYAAPRSGWRCGIIAGEAAWTMLNFQVWTIAAIVHEGNPIPAAIMVWSCGAVAIAVVRAVRLRAGEPVVAPP